ncbi:GH25 family lysozyme [Okibacterium endophyticum]
MRVGIAGMAAVLVLGVCAILIATGVLWPNRLFASSYPVTGVDVSAYQGDIDWRTLADEDIEFAFIKSTEGSGYQDPRFAENWENARSTDLLVGAYHFMSFESEGLTQAQNVIDTVPDAAGSLPVVVDLEFYGGFFEDPPTQKLVRGILDPLLEELEDHYGVPAIIYATPEAYERYLRDAYADNPIWIRSVVFPPRLPDGRDWTIWQYSNRDRLDGYDGDEHYIDINVFDGSIDELKELADG